MKIPRPAPSLARESASIHFKRHGSKRFVAQKYESSHSGQSSIGGVTRPFDDNDGDDGDPGGEPKHNPPGPASEKDEDRRYCQDEDLSLHSHPLHFVSSWVEEMRGHPLHDCGESSLSSLSSLRVLSNDELEQRLAV